MIALDKMTPGARPTDFEFLARDPGDRRRTAEIRHIGGRGLAIEQVTRKETTTAFRSRSTKRYWPGKVEVTIRFKAGRREKSIKPAASCRSATIITT